MNVGAGTPMLVMSLALLGKLCILAAIFVSTLYSIELFPTVVRYGTALLCAGFPQVVISWDCLLGNKREQSQERCRPLKNQEIPTMFYNSPVIKA